MLADGRLRGRAAAAGFCHPHPSSSFMYSANPTAPRLLWTVDLENGMAISVGRVREDSMFSLKFVCLSHNTLRGAAGGGVLLAELLCAKGYL